jgi:hypothetical protein
VDGLQASVEKMRREGIPDAGIDTFRHYYEQLAGGETGTLPSCSAVSRRSARSRRSRSLAHVCAVIASCSRRTSCTHDGVPATVARAYS